MGPAQVCPFSGEQKRRWVRWPDSRRGEVELHLVRSPCFVAYTSSVPSGASNFGLSTKVKRFPFVQMIDGLFTFRASLAELRFLGAAQVNGLFVFWMDWGNNCGLLSSWPPWERRIS